MISHRLCFWVPVLMALIAGIIIIQDHQTSQPPQQRACTLEAKLCPDGSAVGRTGPDCAFAPCPTSPPNDWRSVTQEGISFSYPEHVGGEYVHEVDWPPTLRLEDGVMNCTQAGCPELPAGQTTLITVNGETLCVTKEAEGAAGSIYTQLAYAKQLGQKTGIITFTIREPQCLNYDEPKQSACMAEEHAFDPDLLAAQIFATMSMP